MAAGSSSAITPMIEEKVVAPGKKRSASEGKLIMKTQST